MGNLGLCKSSPLSCPSHLPMRWTSQTPTYSSTTYFSELKKLNCTRENHTTRQMDSRCPISNRQSTRPRMAQYFPRKLTPPLLQHLAPTFLYSIQTPNFPLTPPSYPLLPAFRVSNPWKGSLEYSLQNTVLHSAPLLFPLAL